MAKKRTTKKKSEPEPVLELFPADALFDDVVSKVEVQMQKKGMLVGHDAVIQAIPVPAFSMRYLLQNEGLPLSCIYQVVGPQASYKSTFAMEILRWHRLCGGFGLLNEAETKPTPELRDSLLNYDAGAVRLESCLTFEDWQKKTIMYTKELQKKMDAANGPGRIYPWCVVVDSLTGKASEHTLKNIEKKGHADLHFPVEARQMADFMRAYPQKLLGWPFTFVGVNHLKVQRNPDGSVDMAIPGGWALKFQCAAIIEMEKIGSIKEFATYKAATIRMSMIKNSYGPEDARMQVRFKTWLQEDAPEVFRLHSRFEWWEASILFLATGAGLSKIKAERLVPRMKEACDIHEKAGGSAGKLYWSKALGVTSADAMPAHDLGVRLEQCPEVLSDLYDICGISRRQFFKPGIDYMRQHDEYAHIVAQADAADDKLRQRAALLDQQPSTVEEYPQMADWPSEEQ